MPVASMTGFGHADGEYEAFRWSWELRSVNGRGLDVRVRMPSDLSALESVIREKTAQKFKRGNIQISLQLSRSTGGETQIKINHEALQQVLSVLAEIENQCWAGAFHGQRHPEYSRRCRAGRTDRDRRRA